MADEGGRDAGLWAMADLVTPMAVRVAATLRVADHLADGRRTAPALAQAAGADADTLDRVLRHLVSVGVLRRDGPDGYALTARGEASGTTTRPTPAPRWTCGCLPGSAAASAISPSSPPSPRRPGCGSRTCIRRAPPRVVGLAAG